MPFTVSIPSFLQPSNTGNRVHADNLIRDPALFPDTKFVLLHEAKNDDGIKSFFMDVWELYVKVRPFTQLRSLPSDERTLIDHLSRSYLFSDTAKPVPYRV